MLNIARDAESDSLQTPEVPCSIAEDCLEEIDSCITLSSQ